MSPWERIQLEFAEDHKQIFSVVCLMIRDSSHIHTTSSAKMTEELRNLFIAYAYGLPKGVVTDNGPQYVSQEFELFLIKTE